jgi:type II secretory pathway component PulF
VDGGEPLWMALEREGLLTPQQTWLVRVGEESSSLASHMDTVVAQERRDDMFRGRLLAAMLYPVTVLVIAVVVGLAVSWLILPRLAGVFGSLHIELPLLTRILIGIGVFLGHSGWWAVPLMLLVLTLLVIMLFIAPRTRRSGQALLLATPGIGKLVREIELARFGYVLGSLLKVGVPLDQALDALKGSGSFERYHALYAGLLARITGGRTISQALDDIKGSGSLIPPTVRQVLTTAEQSAHLPEAVAQIGTAYEQRLEVTAKNLIATMEPLLLFIVWIGVVLLAMAVITPIYSVLRGVNQ